MNPGRIFVSRLYQQTLRFFSHFLSFRQPEILEGKDSLSKIPSYLKERGFKHPLLVCGKGIRRAGLEKPLVEASQEAGIALSIYDKVTPNPTFACIYEARDYYNAEKCDSLIALGGGSNMDAAKALGALLANPKKKLEDLRGILKVKGKLPFLIAVPTTAGTGSEATIASVVVNEKTHDKFAINDPKLIPSVAVLDDSLLEGLPPSVVASTGMDALTHAVEAFIGSENTSYTKKEALEAIQLIHDHLLPFYEDRTRDEDRKAMQKASFLAGLAFTRAYVGYVHALAHALGGSYDLPHGYANAVLLPHVLEAYGEKAYGKLAKISDSLSLTDKSLSKKEKAEAVITWIKNLKKSLSIPERFPLGTVKKEDLEALATHADKEANPFYPVPKEMDKGELKQVLIHSSEL